MARPVDLIGKRFGMFEVVRQGERRHGRVSWVCACDCGNFADVITHSLTSGNSTNCGCARVVSMAKRLTKHGLAGTYTYRSWESMMRRCYNDKSADYPRYGGAGITVCAEWHDVENFVRDMGERPKDMSIDRIDGTRGYIQGNCRWATSKTQTENRRTVRMVRIGGIDMPVKRAALELGVSVDAFRARIYRGMDPLDAVKDISTPRSRSIR